MKFPNIYNNFFYWKVIKLNMTHRIMILFFFIFHASLYSELFYVLYTAKTFNSIFMYIFNIKLHWVFHYWKKFILLISLETIHVYKFTIISLIITYENYYLSFQTSFQCVIWVQLFLFAALLFSLEKISFRLVIHLFDIQHYFLKNVSKNYK